MNRLLEVGVRNVATARHHVRNQGHMVVRGAINPEKLTTIRDGAIATALKQNLLERNLGERDGRELISTDVNAGARHSTSFPLWRLEEFYVEDCPEIQGSTAAITMWLPMVVTTVSCGSPQVVGRLFNSPQPMRLADVIGGARSPE